MIYNGDYFREELQKSYLDGGSNRRRLLIVCALIALFAVALNSLANLLTETVVADLMPALCNKSFYSVAQLMNIVIMQFFVFYIAQKYSAATFAEINKNRWYMLVKMGYQPPKIILIKQMTTIIMVVVLYSVSFITAFIVASFLRYSVLTSSIFPLYLTGLLQTMFLVCFIMTCSLFVKRAGTHVLSSLAALVGMLSVSIASGFYDATSGAAGMSLKNMFTGIPSVYIWLLLGLIVILTVVSVGIAYKKSRYYYTRGGKINDVYVMDYKTDKAKKVSQANRRKVKKIVKITVFSAFSLILTLGILANVLIAVMGAASQNKEFTVLGRTPFVFGSRTMEPDISKNDLVVFEKKSDYEYKVGDTVLYYENNASRIKKIVAIEGENVSLDISAYPAGVEKGSQLSVMPAGKLSGVMTFKSRWLGAWFVLNNTVGGRILFLGVPLIVLAFYNSLAKTFGFLKTHLGLAEE